jgi:hypothetical protein
MPSISPPVSVGASTIFVRKSSDQTRNNVSTTGDDTELAVSLAANCHYEFEAFILYDSSATADIKWSLSVPSGATAQWTSIHPASSVSALPGAAQAHKVYAAGDTQVGGAVAAGTKVAAILKGIVRVSTTSGALTFRWAQNTPEVSDTKVLTDSYIKAVRVFPLT